MMSMPFEPLEPLEPRKDLASTYMVPDRFNEKEINRLKLQDGLLTRTMGGVLAEHPDPTHIERLLDIGCGPGGWLIETALAYPQIHLLIGIDISPKVIEIASEQARTQQVEKRVEFQTMDALRMLEFPDNFFDLVNQRLAVSWLRTWDWPKLLQECWRVLRPDGILRLTEINGMVKCNSAAQTRLWELLTQSLKRAGAYFTADGTQFDRELERLLEQHGLQQIQVYPQTVEYHGDTSEGRFFAENVKHLFRTIKPYMQKWTRLPDDYEDIYQQAITDATQPDFSATYELFTLCGTRLFP